MKKAIAVLSGGLDSTTAMHLAMHNNDAEIIGAISFFYGQKHSIELERAKATCKELGIDHKIVDLFCLSDILDSALTSKDQEVPKGHYEEENMKQTVVPNRNMIMTSIAAGYAMSKKADYVILGVHQGDHAIYPDCRPEFIEALDKVIQIADWHKVEILAPVLKCDKTDIVNAAISIGVNFLNTWTCYDPQDGEKPCGTCGSCTERSEAFLKNGMKDPLYSDEEWEVVLKHLESLNLA